MNLLFEHERRYIATRPAAKLDNYRVVGPAADQPTSEVIVVVSIPIEHSPTLVEWDFEKSVAFDHKQRYEWHVKSR